MALHTISRSVLFGGILAVASPAMAVEILYDFETPSTATNIFDVRTADGAQPGQFNQSSGDGVGTGPTFTATGGFNGTRAAQFNPWSNGFGISDMVQTQSVIDYVTGETFSMWIKPSVLPSAGKQNMLTWTGANRGGGETNFGITSNGSLIWGMGGVGNFSTVSSGLVQANTAHFVAVTVQGAGSLTFYVDGVAVPTTPGGLPPTFPGNGHSANSPTQFGWAQNIGTVDQDQYQGVMDNIFVADRALSAAEINALHSIPEPTGAALATALLLPTLARRRRQSSN
jgi:hypothetical protein